MADPGFMNANDTAADAPLSPPFGRTIVDHVSHVTDAILYSVHCSDCTLYMARMDAMEHQVIGNFRCLAQPFGGETTVRVRQSPEGRNLCRHQLI